MNSGCHAMISEAVLVGWKRLPVNDNWTNLSASTGPAPSYVAKTRYACQFRATTRCPPCGVTLTLSARGHNGETTPPLQICRCRCEATDHALLQRISIFGPMNTHAMTKAMHEESAIFDSFRSEISHFGPGIFLTSRRSRPSLAFFQHGFCRI